MRERTRDLVDIINENNRRWSPRWKDLPRPGNGCYKGDVALDDELVPLTDELDDTDESES